MAGSSTKGIFAQRRLWRSLQLFALLAARIASAQDAAKPDASQPLTLQACIEIALRNQPAIAAQRSAVGIAVEQQRIAQSYFYPQVNFSGRLTHLDEHRSVDIANPITGPVADVFSDAAAFFGIAQQAGSAAANAALNQPNLPPFATAKQAALASLPSSIKVDLLGQSFLTNQILLIQPLYTGGKIRFRNQQAKLGISAADADVAKSEQQTVFEVNRAYLSVQLAIAQLAVADETAGQFAAIEELVASIVEQGSNPKVTTADSTRAKSLRLLAETERVRIERAADLARAALSVAIGYSPEAPTPVADPKLEIHEQKVDLDASIALAYAQRPEMRKIDLAIAGAGLEKRLANAQFQPDVALFGSFGTIHDNQDYANPNDPEEWGVGVGVELPLFTGGRRMAQRRQADHRQTQALQWRDALRNTIALEVKQAYLEHLEASQKLEFARQAMQEARVSFDRYRGQYLDGIARADMPQHFRDRQSARLLLTYAQVRYNETIYQYDFALARVRLTTGSGANRDGDR